VVDQLQRDFEREGKPVYFVEHNTDRAPDNRKNRFFAAWPGGGTLYLPLQVCNSGYPDLIASGRVDFERVYRSMVDRALSRTPQAKIDAYFQVANRNVEVQATVKNLSQGAFSGANNATIHAMIVEKRKIIHAGRYVHMHADQLITEELAPGESRDFTFTFRNINLNWSRSYVLVLVDFQPPGSRAFEVAQAAVAIEGQAPTPTPQEPTDPPPTIEFPTATPTPEDTETPTEEPPSPTPDEPTNTPEPTVYEVYLPIVLNAWEFYPED
jgi:hypothetical protein